MVTHQSPRLYISCFLAQSHTRTHYRDTHMHVHTCRGSIQPDTHKHTHADTHSLSLSALLVFTVFHAILQLLKKGEWGWGAGITMCDAASVSTRPGFQIKRTPLFLTPSPPPPFSQIQSLSPPLSAPPPHLTLRHLFFSLSFVSAVQSVSELSFVYYDVWVR